MSNNHFLTDKGDYLLTSKEIREDSGSSAKYLTKKQASNLIINQLSFLPTEYTIGLRFDRNRIYGSPAEPLDGNLAIDLVTWSFEPVPQNKVVVWHSDNSSPLFLEDTTPVKGSSEYSTTDLNKIILIYEDGFISSRIEVFSGLSLIKGLLLHLPFDEDISPKVPHFLYNKVGNTIQANWEFGTGTAQIFSDIGQVHQSKGVPNVPYVLVPTHPILQTVSTQFTVAFWVKPFDGGTGSISFLRWDGDFNPENNGIRILITSNGNLRGYINSESDSAGERVSSSSGAIQQNGEWQHVVMAFDGTNTVLYVNNSQVATSTNHSGRSVLSNPHDIRFMFSNNQVTYYDDFRVYNRVLSPEERIDVYNYFPTNPSPGPPISLGPVLKRLQMSGREVLGNLSRRPIFDYQGKLYHDNILTGAQGPHNRGGANGTIGVESDYINNNTDIVRVNGRVSTRFDLNFLYAMWTGSGPYNGRLEDYIENDHISHPELLWFSYSIFFPESNAIDTLEPYELHFQFHQLGGSPCFSINQDHGCLNIRLLKGDGNDNRMQMALGPATRGVWHDIIVRLEFKYVVDASIAQPEDLGRCTIWYNGKLARLHNPTTKQPWVVPTNIGGPPSNYVALPSKGSFPLVINEGDSDVSLADWYGFTWQDADHTLKIAKWGTYKSVWSSYYNQSTGEPLNIEDPMEANYMPSEFREKTVYIANINFALEEVEHWRIFKALDSEGNNPLDWPSWFQTEP